MTYYDTTDPAYINFKQRVAAKVIDLCVDENLTLSETEDVLQLAKLSASAQKQVAKLGRVKPDELPVFQTPATNSISDSVQKEDPQNQAACQDEPTEQP
jgi:hypothetical protein